MFLRIVDGLFTLVWTVGPSGGLVYVLVTNGYVVRPGFFDALYDIGRLLFMIGIAVFFTVAGAMHLKRLWEEE